MGMIVQVHILSEKINILEGRMVHRRGYDTGKIKKIAHMRDSAQTVRTRVSHGVGNHKMVIQPGFSNREEQAEMRSPLTGTKLGTEIIYIVS